ncbi:cation diffusion facilitator family transporter [Leeia aquatica]|uniref:Cation transporter n=1 Tax=Leeia aquatica TaxID=2725557 RepID=A0A847S029_9NEIS|nr:cation diffusion facilitator family transporter [Leeia aquatica]NLR75261.1 cation transporter [Leeia aquatica]
MSVAEHLDPAFQAERQRAASRSTWVSVWINLGLTVVQVVVGLLARSQALVADGLHSLSDLVADFVVLLANRHSHQAPDHDHHYGHARYETVASLWLGLLLLLVGLGMLWRAGERLTSGSPLPAVHIAALWTALATLLAKELLFRYLLRVAERVRSSMLVANAWHARSDAASSLVVAAGIGGNLLGYHALDSLAAALVGFMVAHMGWKFSWQAIRELTDAAPEETVVADIRATLASTSGVCDVHELRVRKMGDLVLVDAHLLVSPVISVSEGHRIAEQARQRVLEQHLALDALIHIDPEEDQIARNSTAPSREQLLPALASLFDPPLQSEQVVLHYLQGSVDVLLHLQPQQTLLDPTALAAQQHTLQLRSLQLLRHHP